MSLYKVWGTDVDGFVDTPLFIVFWMRGECGKTEETSQERSRGSNNTNASFIRAVGFNKLAEDFGRVILQCTSNFPD